MRVGYHIASAGLVEFRCEQPVVLVAAGVGERPTADVRELGPPDPSEYLVVQQQLCDRGAVQREAARGGVCVGHPLDPDSVEDE